MTSEIDRKKNTHEMNRSDLTSSVIIKRNDSGPCIDVHNVSYVLNEGWYCEDCNENFEDDRKYVRRKILALLDHCRSVPSSVVDPITDEVEEACEMNGNFSQEFILDAIKKEINKTLKDE